MELIFPNSFINMAFTLLFASFIGPILYCIYYGFKRKLTLIMIVAGLAAYLLFGYLLTGLALGTFIPSTSVEMIGAARYTLISAFIIGTLETAGLYLLLLLLKKRNATVAVPVSVGIGFALYNALIKNGFTAYLAMSQAMAVNEYGLDYVVGTVGLTSQDALRAELIELAGRQPMMYLWGTFDCVCGIVVAVCLARLLWYSMASARIAPSKGLIPACLIARVVIELPTMYYNAGGLESYTAAGTAYYALTALLLCFTIFESYRRDDKEKIAAPPVNRRML